MLTSLTRRGFLSLAGATAASGALAGCGASPIVASLVGIDSARGETQGGFGIRYTGVMASAVLGAILLLAVLLLFQRRIVQGVASTGIA